MIRHCNHRGEYSALAFFVAQPSDFQPYAEYHAARPLPMTSDSSMLSSLLLGQDTAIAPIRDGIGRVYVDGYTHRPVHRHDSFEQSRLRVLEYVSKSDASVSIADAVENAVVSYSAARSAFFSLAKDGLVLLDEVRAHGRKPTLVAMRIA